jgi:hypothetical protein
MSLLMQLCLTTKALTVSARAVGAAIALNTRANAAIPTYLNHLFCFIFYLAPILLRSRFKIGERRALRYLAFPVRKLCRKSSAAPTLSCYVELGAD